MAEKVYQLPNGKKYALDLENPEHAAWLEEAAKEGRSTGQEVGRQLGLTARAGVNAIMGLPAMLADAITGPINAAAGTHIPAQLPAVNRALTSLGLPQPENGLERVVQAAAAGAAAPATTGATTLLPAVSGAFSGGAGQAATEAGAGPVASTLIGLGAGMAPGVVAALGNPLARVAEPIKRVFQPYTQAGRDTAKGNLLNTLAGEKRGAVVDALNDNVKFVRGTQNTAAEAAAPAGSTELAALQKMLEKFNSTPARERDMANEAARLAAVRSVGKTPQALAAAEGKRAADAAADYSTAFAQQVKVDPALAQVMSNPYIKDALPEAFKLAKAKGVEPGTDLTQFLHLVKQVVDSKLAVNAGQQGGLTGTVRETTLRAQNALVDWLRTNNPQYDLARENFARNSKPINQMQVGQYLEGKLAAPLADAERPGVFAQAMRDAPGTIKRATGNPRYDELKDVLPPIQLKIVEGVLQDLARKRTVADQAKAGRGAVTNTLSSAFETVEPPGMLNRGIMLTRAILQRMQHGTSQKVLQELAADMQDPAKVAHLMSQLPPKERLAAALLLQQAAGGSAAALPQINAQE